MDPLQFMGIQLNTRYFGKILCKNSAYHVKQNRCKGKQALPRISSQKKDNPPSCSPSPPWHGPLAQVHAIVHNTHVGSACTNTSIDHHHSLGKKNISHKPNHCLPNFVCMVWNGSKPDPRRLTTRAHGDTAQASSDIHLPAHQPRFIFTPSLVGSRR